MLSATRSAILFVITCWLALSNAQRFALHQKPVFGLTSSSFNASQSINETTNSTTESSRTLAAPIKIASTTPFTSHQLRRPKNKPWPKFPLPKVFAPTTVFPPHVIAAPEEDDPTMTTENPSSTSIDNTNVDLQTASLKQIIENIIQITRIRLPAAEILAKVAEVFNLNITITPRNTAQDDQETEEETTTNRCIVVFPKPEDRLREGFSRILRLLNSFGGLF